MPFDPAVDIDRLPVEPGCYLMRAADDDPETPSEPASETPPRRPP